LALRAPGRARLHAFAEALLDGGERLPAAGAEGVPVVEPVRALLARAPRRVRLGVQLALTLFELSTFPRRFSRRPLRERVARLERIDAGPAGLWRELYAPLKSLCALAYASDAGVRSLMGVSATCTRAGGDAPTRRPPPIATATPPSESFDVVIVGSGAGGATAARVLAEKGLSVTVLEEGDSYDRSSYPDDPLRALAALYRGGGLTYCEGRPAIPLPLGRCLGGTTVINSGTCFRTPDDVLVRWRDELGIAWATELEREFEQLERDLKVQPVDPASAGRNAELCRIGADAIGASNGPISRNAGDVVRCGTCPAGCVLDAKQATHVSELPRAVDAGCRVRAGARVNRVLVESGRAVGVAGSSAAGRFEVRAGAVVVAAGAIGTPELLLSQGVANASGELGRNLHIHPACWVGARFDEVVRGWEGVMQSWHVGEWQDRGLFLEATFTPFAFGAHWLPGAGPKFMARVEQYDQLAVIGVHLAERVSAGRVRAKGGRGRIGYRLRDADAAAIRYGIARAADIHFAAGAREVYPPIAGLPIVERQDGAGSIERGRRRPRDLRLEAFHPMGTARMGSDPLTSVVSPSGEVHDVPGLYIADASILPTTLGVNPMITIMACARRIAHAVGERIA
jgi:choline dehydrogenase-like flavoprotein